MSFIRPTMAFTSTSSSQEGSGHLGTTSIFRSTFYFLPFFVFFICLVFHSGKGNDVAGYSDGFSYGEDKEDMSPFDAREVYDIGNFDKRARYGSFRGDLGKRQSVISFRDMDMDPEIFKRLKDVLARKGRVSRKFRGDLGKRSFAPTSLKDVSKENY